MFHVSQDIFLEEDRHQQAMMALESSVLGCGSDDWSVDSDYAFQDFADDVKHHHHHQQQGRHEKSEQNLLQSSSPTRERSAVPNPETPSNMRVMGNLDDNSSAETTKLHEHTEEAGGARADTLTAGGTQAAGGGGGVILEEGEVGGSREGSASESGKDNPHHPILSNTRLFGDPGSSSESTHILRLEQRMFLKVSLLMGAVMLRNIPRNNLGGSPAVHETCECVRDR